jgi:hypothetical protein
LRIRVTRDASPAAVLLESLARHECFFTDASVSVKTAETAEMDET